jgi:hypothetical protein
VPLANRRTRTMVAVRRSTRSMRRTACICRRSVTRSRRWKRTWVSVWRRIRGRCRRRLLGEPGQNSVAETDHFEAESMARGEIKRPRMFYFHRQASDDWDMESSRIGARRFGRRRGRSWRRARILRIWRRCGTFPARISRISSGCGRTGGRSRVRRRSTLAQFKTLARPQVSIPRGAYVTVGFDGAKFRDCDGVRDDRCAHGVAAVRVSG